MAVDDRVPERPVLFGTEVRSDGTLRRVEASGWDSLGDGGVNVLFPFLRILDDVTLK